MKLLFMQTKFAIKAFKMNVNQIKTLCNFFAVDCSGEDGRGRGQVAYTRAMPNINCLRWQRSV